MKNWKKLIPSVVITASLILPCNGMQTSQLCSAIEEDRYADVYSTLQEPIESLSDTSFIGESSYIDYL